MGYEFPGLVEISMLISLLSSMEGRRLPGDGESARERSNMHDRSFRAFLNVASQSLTEYRAAAPRHFLSPRAYAPSRSIDVGRGQARRISRAVVSFANW